MRKLVESTFVSLDGVISRPEKWGAPYWNDEHADYAHNLLFSADALLLGRDTYEVFADSWPKRPGNEFTDRINSMPKHVASRTLQDAEWNSTIIKGDVPQEVAKLKQDEGQNLLKYGTGQLTQTLMEHGLVDEFHFWIFPVVVGGGDRLLEGMDMTHLKLIDTTRFSTGIVVMKFTPNGITAK
jgi:dihydrofolate reductase